MDYLSFTEAADFLNVSEKWFIEELIDGCRIPYVEVCSEKLVSQEHLEIYEKYRAIRRRAIMEHLTALSQEMGLYD